MDYIISKGSACVEAFREVSHLVARFFGDSDRSRKSKEAGFAKDMEVLVQKMESVGLHKPSFELEHHFVPAVPTKSSSKNKKPVSAIVDTITTGMAAWNDGKFSEFIKSTSYDEAVHGYPVGQADEDMDMESGAEGVERETIFDQPANPLTYSTHDDVHGDRDDDTTGALGGGGDFYDTTLA